MVRPSHVPFSVLRPFGRHMHLWNSPESEEKPETLAQRIERETRRTLTLDTSLEANFSKCHSQHQSILYHTLPKEIRDLIFTFATAPFEDLAQQYGDNERYYRPGYRAPRKVDTNLLLTCRRVWLEANALPMRQTVFTFWYYMPPPPLAEPRPAHLTTLNQHNLTTVQLFLQLCEAERLSDDPNTLAHWMDWLRPKVLRVTIRHSDWWDWEKHVPLKLPKDRWVQIMLNSACTLGIEQVQLELETIDSKKAQLDPIVQWLQRLESTPRLLNPDDPNCRVGVFLRISGGPTTWYWTGSAGLKGNPLDGHEQFSVPHQGLKRLDYHVKVITWRLARTKMDPPSTESAPSTQPTFLPRHQPLHSRPLGRRWPLFRAGRRQPSFLMSPAYSHNSELHFNAQRHGWDQLPFPITNDEVQYASMASADDIEGRRRDHFEQVIADMKAKEYQKLWDEQSSLLKFLPSPRQGYDGLA